jgi:AcrR family transcriptional regulator
MTIADGECGVRTRNSADTRAAILAAARRRFAQESYDAVGLRQIAADVGVDKALVNRYFGSKEQLFREVLCPDMEDGWQPSSTRELAERLVDDILDADPLDGPRAGLLMLLRSLSSPDASALVHQSMKERVLGPLEAVLEGHDRQMRAGTAIALLLGACLMGHMVGDSPLTGCEKESLKRRLLGMMERALEDDPQPCSGV